MKLLELHCKLLTEFEVHSLTPYSAEINPALKTLQHELRTYFLKSPCSIQTRSKIQLCIKSLTAFSVGNKGQALTECEVLMLVNCRPATPIDVVPIVEECASRLGDDGVAQILQILDQYLPVFRRPL